MGDSKASASHRPEQLDRAAFAAYFLGAVFPLATLAVVVELYVLPELGSGIRALGLIGLVVSLAALSLGSFLALRRTTRASIARMDQDNHRLESLLRVSSALASAEHGHEATAITASCALELTSTDAAFVLAKSREECHPIVLESAGEGASEIFETAGKTITELAALVIDEKRPALRGADLGGRAVDAKKSPSAAVVPIPGDNGALGALAVVHLPARAGIDPAQLDALSTLGALASVALRNAELRDSQRNFFSHVTEILVAALDAHLDFNNGHGHRVARYANKLGREVGLDDDDLQRLHFAALLHDIGMLKIERRVKMTAKACRAHPKLGSRMLGGIRLWEELAPIVHSHHERWDGNGYPDGLEADDIPLLSRIIGICEAFDAITSDTSYKIAGLAEDALAEIEDGAGTQFDPGLAGAFQTLFRRGEIEV